MRTTKLPYGNFAIVASEVIKKILMQFVKSLLGTLLFGAALLAGDVSGKWKAVVETPNGDKLELAFELKGDDKSFTGTVNSQMGEAKVVDGKSEGDNVEFVVVMDANGEARRLPHKAKLVGDEMKITLSMGDRTIEYTAKREK